jgi:hypothetical protein
MWAPCVPSWQEQGQDHPDEWSMGTGTMNLPFRHARAVAASTAGAAAVPASGPPNSAAAGPAGNEREYGCTR